jgi:phage terminase large subunit-like protein
VSAVADLALPPHLAEDPEALEDLAQLEAIFEANPLEAYNHPEISAVFPSYKVHEKQMAFHAIQAPPLGIKALIAANRSGKTVACVVDDIIQLVDEDLLPEHLKPFKKFQGPITIWVGAPKNDTHFKNTVPLFRKFMPKAALIAGQFGKSFKSQPAPELRLKNGSTVAFKTYDQDKDAWASAEVHRIHWDEEPNIQDSRGLRDEAAARLISTNGDEIIGMTPLLGMSWVHDDVWQVRDTDPLVSVIQMGMEDNPYNSQEAIDKFAARLTEDEKRMRLHGEFVHLGGMFYEEFADRKHIVDPITPDHLEGQEIVVGIDPGRERTGVVWLAFDKDNAAVVFDEFNPGKEAVVPDVAAEIKRRNLAWDIKDAIYVIDPSSRNTTAINADAVEAAYARAEIYCQRGQNDRAAGILEIKRRLQDAEPNGTPAPSLTFTRNCGQTIKQMREYRRDPAKADEWAAVAQTMTTRFDLIDAVRYAVMSRTWTQPYEQTQRRPAYQPNFQPAYATEREFFMDEPAPLGDFS